MPRYTLLEMTQDILNDISGDYINNITDTEESDQVASIIKTTYWDLIEENHSKWEHLKKLVTLDSSNDITKPNYLKLPSSVYNIWFIKYNKRTSSDTRDKYDDVCYLTPKEFIDYVNSRDDSQTNVTQISDFSNVELNILTDIAPTYWTTFDDDYIVFDAYDSSLEQSLQASKSQAHVTSIPTWTHTDTSVPDLPPQAFSLLLSEAKSVAWNSLKQLPNPKEEQRAGRQRGNIAQNSHQVSRNEKRKRYGRRSRK